MKRQTKAVIGTAVLFLVLAGVILYKPAPDLVPSPELVEQLRDADYEVRRGKAFMAAKAVERVGLTLSDWSRHGGDLSSEQRSDLSMHARDARMLAAGMPGRGKDLDKASATDWVGLHGRIDATFAGD